MAPDDYFARLNLLAEWRYSGACPLLDAPPPFEP
jgi:hypothetical protein